MVIHQCSKAQDCDVCGMCAGHCLHHFLRQNRQAIIGPIQHSKENDRCNQLYSKNKNGDNVMEGRADMPMKNFGDVDMKRGKRREDRP